MYQITAIYEGSEVAYAEGEDFTDAAQEVLTQINYSIYAAVSDDMTLLVIKPSGRRCVVKVAGLTI